MTVKELYLYKDNDKYYLSAVFGYEDKNGIYEMSVPRIEFPMSFDCTMDLTIYDAYYQNEATIDFGFGKFNVLPFDGKDKYYKLTCLEEKVHEMTLDEIEKELGYKIKLKENNK
jgi:hypothetical protein